MEHSSAKKNLKLYNIEEARVIFEDLPSDDGLTDEEQDDECFDTPISEIVALSDGLLFEGESSFEISSTTEHGYYH